MHSILVTTECVADLPEEILSKYAITSIFYDISTEEGMFKDTAEIDARNMMEYIRDGKKKAQSVVPTPADYRNFFNKALEKYDEVIHICISSGISPAYDNAKAAQAKMGIDGRKVKVVDSKHLSSGQGILTVEAAKLRDEGKNSAEILAEIDRLIPLIETSFIVNNADYLYLNGKVDKTVKNMCSTFKIHPVLYMNEDGRLTIKRILLGNYEKACAKYVKGLLKKSNQIDESIGFVTYAGCTHEKLSRIEKLVNEYCPFNELYEIQASATVSCNCGPDSFGVLFKKKGGAK